LEPDPEVSAAPFAAAGAAAFPGPAAPPPEVPTRLPSFFSQSFCSGERPVFKLVAAAFEDSVLMVCVVFGSSELPDGLSYVGETAD
jgi:hypothetical protein